MGAADETDRSGRDNQTSPQMQGRTKAALYILTFGTGGYQKQKRLLVGSLSHENHNTHK